MIEEQWIKCSDPRPMLSFLRSKGWWLWRVFESHSDQPVSPRKLRLFAAACCRRFHSLPLLLQVHEAVAIAERFSDGEASEAELQAADRQARSFRGSTSWWSGCLIADKDPWKAARFESDAQVGRESSFGFVEWPWKEGPTRRRREECFAQAGLLRCIFNPFRPTPSIDPALLAKDNCLIVKLALAAYNDRLLPSGHLDPARLAVLADALDEAGADAAPLDHLRGPGPHVRGCFVLDLLLQKE